PQPGTGAHRAIRAPAPLQGAGREGLRSPDRGERGRGLAHHLLPPEADQRPGADPGPVGVPSPTPPERRPVSPEARVSEGRFPGDWPPPPSRPPRGAPGTRPGEAPWARR